jgi:ABC-type phosphate/phosphonate transport system substrate-binding protein
MTVASLAMYDLGELHAANDALWAAVARRVDAPIALTRGVELMSVWTDPGLLLAQTCGYPLVTSLDGRVRYLGTPCYDVPGCEGPNYRSALIVRAADRATHLRDLRGGNCAINDLASNSGMNVLRAEIAPLAEGGRFFGDTLLTGSHAASAEAVARGQADLASIDCVTWAHLQRYRPPITDQLRVLSWTVATPGLPFITSIHTDVNTVEILRDALEAEGKSATLRLDGFQRLPLSAYDAILRLEAEARAIFYPQIA